MLFESEPISSDDKNIKEKFKKSYRQASEKYACWCTSKPIKTNCYIKKVFFCRS